MTLRNSSNDIRSPAVRERELVTRELVKELIKARRSGSVAVFRQGRLELYGVALAAGCSRRQAGTEVQGKKSSTSLRRRAKRGLGLAVLDTCSLGTSRSGRQMENS